MKPTNEARHGYLVVFFSVTVLFAGGCGVKGSPVAPDDLLPDTTVTSIEDDEGDEQESDSYTNGSFTVR